jgi:hypothetical protein
MPKNTNLISTCSLPAKLPQVLLDWYDRNARPPYGVNVMGKA